MNIRKILIFIGLIVLCTSCKDNLFNFDIHHIEADGEWGIPVYNDAIHVDKLLNKLDSVKFLQVGEDGTLIFVMDAELKQLLSVKDVIKFPEKSFEKSGTIPINQSKNTQLNISQLITANLNTEEFFLRTVTLNSGQITITFNITSIQIPYTVTISAGNILDEHGDSLTITRSNNQTTSTIDLSRYTLRTNENGDIKFSAKLNIDISHLDPSVIASLSSLDYYCGITIKDLEIKNIIGRFIPVSSNITHKIGFSFPIDKLHIDGIHFSNPHITILGKNGLCKCNGTINQLAFFNAAGQTSPIILSSQSFSAPLSPDNYTTLFELQNTPIQYNTSYDSIKFDCGFVINPDGLSAGDIYINDASTIDLKANMEIPANLSIDNAIYKDTTDNALRTNVDPALINSIESITLRVAIVNDLPFDVVPEITFLNSTTQESYRLDLGELQIHGAYNNVPNHQQPVFVELDSETAQKVVKSDKIILNFSINTMGHQVSINTAQYIHPSIGAKIKYSNINF